MNASNSERIEGTIRIVFSFCRFILGLPGPALLLRVAWMEGTIWGRNVLELVSLAKFCYDPLISRFLSLVKNAHFEKRELARQ